MLIAAITSCTNTSNPERDARRRPAREESRRARPDGESRGEDFARAGSRVVTDYLTKTGLQPYLDQLGFQTVGYGCTTCIGNSGPLHPALEEAIAEERSHRRQRAQRQPQLRGARASEHQGELPHVAAARRRLRARRPRRYRPDQRAARQRQRRQRRLPAGHLADARAKSATPCRARSSPEVFRRLYTDFADAESEVERNPAHRRRRLRVGSSRAPTSRSRRSSRTSAWSPGTSARSRARARSASSATRVTTDHISPAGAIKKTSPAGEYLIAARRRVRGLQQLRLAPRQRSRHDARHLRQRAHQEPHGARRRRRRDASIQPERRAVMPIYDAAIKYQSAAASR